MRTLRNLFPTLCSLEHLEEAAATTVRGKRRRPDVAWFLFHLDEELASLRHALRTGTYEPSGLDLVSIRDPKPRLIARVPIQDRVVHTAVVKLMEPGFLPSLTADAYACRQGFGTHRAVLRLKEYMGWFRFAVHLDIRSYFPSIRFDLVKSLLRRRIRDPAFLDVVDRILDVDPELYTLPEHRRIAALDDDWPPPGRGLPIGSYTSQLFAAHVYLSDFDHFVKRKLHVPGYLRYVDDLFCFANARSDLRRWRAQIREWLLEHRDLRLKHPNARILSCLGHLDALGHRIRRDSLTALPRAGRRLQHRVVQELKGQTGTRKVDLARSLAASRGVLLT